MLKFVYLEIEQKQQSSEIELFCSCPPSCTCPNKDPKYWYHKTCGKKVNLNIDGDIYCKNVNCKPFFIQHAEFICQDKKTQYKFRSAGEFLMSLAQGLQTAEYKLKDNDLQVFTERLIESVQKKWFN